MDESDSRITRSKSGLSLSKKWGADFFTDYQHGRPKLVTTLINAESQGNKKTMSADIFQPLPMKLELSMDAERSNTRSMSHLCQNELKVKAKTDNIPKFPNKRRRLSRKKWSSYPKRQQMRNFPSNENENKTLTTTSLAISGKHDLKYSGSQPLSKIEWNLQACKGCPVLLKSFFDYHARLGEVVSATQNDGTATLSKGLGERYGWEFAVDSKENPNKESVGIRRPLSITGSTSKIRVVNGPLVVPPNSIWTLIAPKTKKT